MKLFSLIIIFFFTFFTDTFGNNTDKKSLENQTIKVVYANKWKPYSYGNGTAVKGILVDIVDEILSKQLKLNVEHIGQPWKRAQKSVRAGLMDAMITAPTVDRLSYSISSANEIYSLQWRAFVSKKSPSYEKVMKMNEPLDDRSLYFISLLGDRTSEYFYEQNRIEYKSVQNISNAIQMLDRGRVDIFIHSRIIMNENLNKLGLKDSVSMHKKKYKTIPFTFLVSKKLPWSKELASKIDKAVNNMKENDTYEKMIEEIIDRNLGSSTN